MVDIAAADDIVQADFFLYSIDTVDRSMIGKLARRTVGKNFNTKWQFC